MQTVQSYISAIRSVLTDINIFVDEDKYLLRSLTRACRLQNDRIVNRFAIQKGMMELLIKTTIDYFLGKGQMYLG